MTNSVDPEKQSDLGLHYLLRLVCPKAVIFLLYHHSAKAAILIFDLNTSTPYKSLW